MFQEELGDRPEVPNGLIIITDTTSTDKANEVEQEARLLNEVRDCLQRRMSQLANVTRTKSFWTSLFKCVRFMEAISPFSAFTDTQIIFNFISPCLYTYSLTILASGTAPGMNFVDEL